MTYLLAEMALCLVLALLAGWYIGWTWRGFREKDGRDDLRHTLRATEEVKDRELAEAQRRADALEAKVETLQRRSERMADEIADRPGPRPLPAVEHPPEPPEPEASEKSSSPDPEAAEEAERLRETERALAAKTAAVLELQAEIANLRSGAERRADRIAKLEARLVELEPLEERLEAVTDERNRLRAELEEVREEQEADDSRLAALAEETRELEEALLERDRRINALRQRYQDTAARLEVAEADQQALRKRLARKIREVTRSEDDDQDFAERLRAAERDLAEARGALRSQIDRTRRQEAVHQQVVSNLRSELRAARAAIASARSTSAPEHDGRIRQLIAARDSHILSLRRRVQELEGNGGEARAAGRDDLQKIPGIGPKLEELLNSLGITRFAQIASWSNDDVERFGERLGSFRRRIAWNDWVENARRQHILEYGEPPSATDQGS